MDYKGYCLWADDVPNPSAPHYVVITSSENPEGRVLVVAISSIKYNDKGIEKYYDKSCVLSVKDIVDEKGNYVLTKPSFVRYEYATDKLAASLLEGQFAGKYQYKCKISDELLLRIQEGAKISPELEPRFKRFFEYF